MFFKKTRTLLMIAGTCFLITCTVTKKPVEAEKTAEIKPMEPVKDTVISYPFLETVFRKDRAAFNQVLQHRKDWNVQVIYTQVNRDAGGRISLSDQYFNADPQAYFYPASTVKLPIVLLALQKLNELKDRGIDRNTTIITETGPNGQIPAFNDPLAADGRPTIAGYIKKILLVSDNDAFNRLYEFLGHHYINTELQKKGYKSAQIRHRLNIFLTDEENRNTNPVKFLDSNGRVIYSQPSQRSGFVFSARKDSLGKGFMRGVKLMAGPMDFSAKNRISLGDLHQVLISLVYPETVKASQCFNLSADDRAFVLKYMSQLPTESSSPPYADQPGEFHPAYGKFLLFGAEKGALPANIRIFNKIGDAYGFLLDIAFVVDFKSKTEYFLSAVIYCNTDGILNDDKYDYKTIGLPFMKKLGQLIHDVEIKREKKFPATVEQFIFEYD